MINKQVTRLEIGSDKYYELTDALERVLEQPAGATKGNHAYLCHIMYEMFRVHPNKGEAVEGAIWALWREGDLMSMETDDIYVWELKKTTRRRRAHDRFSRCRRRRRKCRSVKGRD